MYDSVYEAQLKKLRDRIAELEQPIPTLLFCPNCGYQHVDLPAPRRCTACGSMEEACGKPCRVHHDGLHTLDAGWPNPPHRTHECQSCQYQWRPCDLPTTGVAEIKTKGQHDQSAVPKRHPHGQDVLEVLRRHRDQWAKNGICGESDALDSVISEVTDLVLS